MYKFLKIRIRLMKRWLLDFFSLRLFQFAKHGKSKIPDFEYFIELEQPIKKNKSTIPKLHNLSIAIKSIEKIVIYPKQIFSFWKIVGNPTTRRGFLASRSLINGKLEPSIGGGLCQLSGLLYYLSLFAGLCVIERYNHSIDIYTESTRFTPLGSDATVAYGYKDLRLKNNLSVPIKFSFLLTDNKLKIRLNTPIKIKHHSVDFLEKKIENNKIKVSTLVDNTKITESIYKKLV